MCYYYYYFLNNSLFEKSTSETAQQTYNIAYTDTQNNEIKKNKKRQSLVEVNTGAFGVPSIQYTNM